MEIRKITESEREQILLGDRYAYSNWTEDEINPSSLETIICDQTLAAFKDDKIVAALTIHSFQQVVRGAIKEMGGIGGVWTYPEYRNQGCVRELLKAAFREMQAKGQSVSMLIPFKQSFYQKFDYVTTNSNLEVRIPIASINAVKLSGEWELERISASAVQSEFSEFMQTQAQLQASYHGMVLPLYWSQWQWQGAVRDKQCIVVKHLGKIKAIAIYRVDSKITERKIYLDHFLWTDIAARHQLFSFFGTHLDQINYLYLDLPYGINFHQWFGDVMGMYELHIHTPPYMVRAIDIAKVISNIPTQRDGIIHIHIHDPNCDWNSGIFSLKSENHILNICRNSHGNPVVKCTIQGISALIYGISLDEVEAKGWLKFEDDRCNDEERSLLESWFPPMPVYNTWKF
jgi:predicted acetyltransferase